MTLDFLSLLAADAEAFAAAIETGPAAAEIAGCPGWTVSELGTHLGFIHRWARAAILSGAMPQLDPASDPSPDDLVGIAGWVRDGAARLLTTLHELDPQQPTWHPFAIEPKVAGLWRRRQAQEASVHRWDAQRAIGLAPTIEAEYATDGVDEYWTVILPRVISRQKLAVPTSVFAVETTDTEQRWVVDGGGGTVSLGPEGAAASARLRGDAESVLLMLWGRPVPDGVVEVSGDRAVADAWLALGGA